MSLMRDKLPVRILRRIKSSLQLPWAGGLFKITPELIMFVNLQFAEIATHKTQRRLILLDSFDNPILIENVEKFYVALRERYYEVLNDYYDDYTKTNTIRSVNDLNI